MVVSKLFVPSPSAAAWFAKGLASLMLTPSWPPKSGDLNLTLNGTTSTNTDHNLGSSTVYGAKIFAVVSGSNYTSSTAISAFTCLADAEI